MPQEGEIKTNRMDPNRKAVWSGGQWYEIGGGGQKPLPVGVQKLEADDLEMLGAAGSISRSIGTNRQRIDGGELNLGPIENRLSEAKNWIGMSDPNSRNYASFRSSLEKMRNDSLRLNKGVQTEGDAVRAWNEIMANINDEALVSQRLSEIEQINARAAEFRGQVINQRRQQYGQTPIDTKTYMGNAFAPGQGKMGVTGRNMAADAQRVRRPASGAQPTQGKGWKVLSVE
jgi:hypothetical protein